jgi:hypothetical protein
VNIISKTDWKQITNFSIYADRMTAWHLREFVKALNEEDVSDFALIEYRRSNKGHFTGLYARIEETRPSED